MPVIVRAAVEEDAAGIASLSREIAAYYVEIAPERFKAPDEEGLVEFFRDDGEWRDRADTIAPGWRFRAYANIRS